MRKSCLILLLTCMMLQGLVRPTAAFGAAVRIPESGQPLKAGALDGVGPLAFPGIRNQPVGVVSVFGSERPDLFLLGNRHGSGLFLYKYLETRAGDVPVFANPVETKTPFDMKNFPPVSIYQSDNGQICGLWLIANELVRTIFDKTEYTWSIVERVELAQAKLPEDVAREVNLSRRHLYKKFMTAAGHSVFDEITKNRIQHICKLLTETDWPIQKITMALGFTEIEHIARYFKRETGLSPNEYRKKFNR